MRTRWGQRTTAAWAVVLVAAIAVAALLARATVLKSTSPPKSEQTLRLDPGTGQARSRAAAGGGQTASAISGGDYSTCALVQGATVECWGDDAHGQLGDGAQLNTLTPVKVSLGRPALAIAAGGSHACAVLTDDTLRCWGANTHGELGDGSHTDSATPVPVPGLRGALQVVAGVAHTCALTRSHRVFCWGANGNGQVGDGTRVDRLRPVAVAGFRGTPVGLTAGLAHTCALMADGTAACWGSNANGELGNGTLVDSPVPADVVGTTGPVKSVDAGDAHTCALLVDGSVECWGWNIEGQLGNGSGSDSAMPVAVTGLRGAASAIAAGGSHTCALLGSGGVECWGANLYGQLGNGTTSDSPSPVAASGLQNGVVAVAAGLYHSCALLSGGSATCWGWNQQGQLGSGTTTSASEPVGVARLGLAPDGTGVVRASPTSVANEAKHATIAFTYAVAPGGMHEGTLAITVPLGWSTPSTLRTAPGYVQSTAGRVAAAGRTIMVTGLNLASGGQVIVAYGSTSGGGPGASFRAGGGLVWRTREQSSPSGNLSALRTSPLVRVLSADGSGEVATRTTVVPSGATGRTVEFDFTAAPGGVEGSTVTLTVPPGWSPPSTSAASPGYTTASSGAVAVAGRTVSVIGVSLRSGGRLRIAFGDRRAGGPGARGPSTAVGAQPWAFGLRASPAGSIRPLAASPQVVVLAPNGSGSIGVSQSTVANGARGMRLSFTYEADAGGMQQGVVILTVPRGWSPPSRDAGAPGYVTASQGTPLVDGRRITLPVKSLGSAATVTLTYGAGGGATAPSTNVGTQQWPTAQRSTPNGAAKALGTPAQVTVLSADGSGILSRATGPVKPGSAGNTVAFEYTAATGGLDDGTVTLTVPDGWDPPSTGGSDRGYTTASAGNLSVSGRTITITNVTLGSGRTLTVIYGSRAGGGPGATAPAKNVGQKVWRASEQSTSSGSLKPLR